MGAGKKMSQVSTTVKSCGRRRAAGGGRPYTGCTQPAEARMVREYLKRHTLLFCFAVVLVPLLILLGMQFVWLGHLKSASAIAHKAALHNFLESVGADIQFVYRSGAERALNIPAS